MGEVISLGDARRKREERKSALLEGMTNVTSFGDAFVFQTAPPGRWVGECATCGGPLGHSCFSYHGAMFCEACGPPIAS